MTSSATVYDLLAQVLSYPRAEYLGIVEQCQQLLRQDSPEAARPLERFAERVHSLTLEDLEELFTRTFDLNPLCCLEVGWHLYGEDYNRGAFLVKMRYLLRNQGVAESTELPDHLSNLLPLLGRLEEQEASRLSSSFVLPALKKMEEGLAGQNNPYEEVLRAVRRLVAVPGSDAVESIPQGAAIGRKEE